MGLSGGSGCSVAFNSDGRVDHSADGRVAKGGLIASSRLNAEQCLLTMEEMVGRGYSEIKHAIPVDSVMDGLSECVQKGVSQVVVLYDRSSTLLSFYVPSKDVTEMVE